MSLRMPYIEAEIRYHSTIVEMFEEKEKQFRPKVRDARDRSIKVANRASRSAFNPVRPRTAARPGRSGGPMKSFINWVPKGPGVQLDLPALDRGARYWIIQEVGTGQKATMRQGGSSNKSTARTVKSQRGRKISRRLVWAAEGHFAPANYVQYGRQQLELASQVSGVPFNRKRMVIRNEIVGQHFIQKGAEAGFRTYERSVLAAARETFRKQGKKS